MNSIDEIRMTAAAAVSQRAGELRGNAETANLFGFALCTDDGLSTLYHVACTREWVHEKELRYPSVGCVYVEWTLSDHDQYSDRSASN